MDDESSFFERERDKLAREITSGFEELLSSSNALNRKLEEVMGMTREYETIASLWHSFYKLMRESGKEDDLTEDDSIVGLPGTGGHVIAGAGVGSGAGVSTGRGGTKESS